MLSFQKNRRGQSHAGSFFHMQAVPPAKRCELKECHSSIALMISFTAYPSTSILTILKITDYSGSSFSKNCDGSASFPYRSFT